MNKLIICKTLKHVNLRNEVHRTTGQDLMTSHPNLLGFFSIKQSRFESCQFLYIFVYE